MSKNVKSVALSIAGMMIAVPAGAEIASTAYVDRIIGETHIQGSVLQFGKLTEEPAFILGAATDSGVSDYGAVSIAELALTLGSQIAGSAITGFATGSGSFVLVGDGTTSGSAKWSTIPQMVMANPPYSGTGEFVFMGFDAENDKLIGVTSGRFNAFFMGKAGPHIKGYGTGSGSFVLVGDGTTSGSAMWQGMSTMGPSIAGYEGYNGNDSGTLHLLAGAGGTGDAAGWIDLNNLALQLPGSWIAGFGSFFLTKEDDSASARYILGQGIESGSLLSGQSAEWFRVNRLGKYLAGFDTVTASIDAADVTHFLGGVSGADSTPKWTSVKELGRHLPGSSISQYGSGLGNYVLVGRSGAEEDVPGWRHISEILLSGLRGENWNTTFDESTWTDTFLVSDKTRSGSAYWAGVDWLLERMPGSVISHYGNSIQENTEGTLYMLGGDGTESGTARWVSPSEFAFSIPGSFLAGFDSGSVNGSAEYQQPMYILGQNVYNDKDSLKMQSPAWYSLGQMGNNLAGFTKYTGSFTGDINEENLSLLIGSGDSTSNAQWASIVDVLYSGVHKTYLDDYNGFGVLMRTMRSGDVAWREASNLSQFVNGASVTGYGTGTGSYVLVGDGTENSGAKWSSVTEMLRNGLVNTPPTGTFSVPVHLPNNTIAYVGEDPFVSYMVPGSLIKRYGTGTGSYVLVGNATGGPARYMGAASLSQYMQGSAISGYNTVTGQPSYILGSSASGTAAKPALYPMSGLGSKIEFKETKTAAQLSASTGTIYFPVIQDGKIYGVTLNDFYILMNAQF